MTGDGYTFARVMLFSSTRLCAHGEPQCVLAWRHEYRSRALLQVAIHALEYVLVRNARNVKSNGISARECYSSSNRAVLYI